MLLPLCFIPRLFLQGSSSATRTLAGASVGAGALTAHGQTAFVTQTAVSSQIDKALDRQLNFAAKIAFNGKFTDLFANALELGVVEVFDFLGQRHTGGFADTAGARSTDAK